MTQPPFDQVLVTILARTGGPTTAQETVQPEKPSIIPYVHCPPDAPPVRTKQGQQRHCQLSMSHLRCMQFVYTAAVLVTQTQASIGRNLVYTFARCPNTTHGERSTPECRRHCAVSAHVRSAGLSLPGGSPCRRQQAASLRTPISPVASNFTCAACRRPCTGPRAKRPVQRHAQW